MEQCQEELKKAGEKLGLKVGFVKLKDSKVFCPKCGSLNVVKGRQYGYWCRNCKTKFVAYWKGRK